ncbi:MAG: hypothetical protein ACLP1X_32690 [Polyangiaceae bacterium]
MKPAASASLRLFRVMDAIEEVVRRLSALPASAEVTDLRHRIEESLREADRSRVSARSPEELERLMRRVLRLHVEVAKLERQIPGT